MGNRLAAETKNSRKSTDGASNAFCTCSIDCWYSEYRRARPHPWPCDGCNGRDEGGRSSCCAKVRKTDTDPKSCQGIAATQQDSLRDALNHSKRAAVQSENAFFDPTMVSMLYFPEDHKYAIYVPLFVPISVPLAVALIREVKSFLGAVKGRAKVHAD